MIFDKNKEKLIGASSLKWFIPVFLGIFWLSILFYFIFNLNKGGEFKNKSSLLSEGQYLKGREINSSSSNFNLFGILGILFLCLFLIYSFTNFLRELDSRLPLKFENYVFDSPRELDPESTSKVVEDVFYSPRELDPESTSKVAEDVFYSLGELDPESTSKVAEDIFYSLGELDPGSTSKVAEDVFYSPGELDPESTFKGADDVFNSTSKPDSASILEEVIDYIFNVNILSLANHFYNIPFIGSIIHDVMMSQNWQTLFLKNIKCYPKAFWGKFILEKIGCDKSSLLLDTWPISGLENLNLVVQNFTSYPGNPLMHVIGLEPFLQKESLDYSTYFFLHEGFFMTFNANSLMDMEVMHLLFSDIQVDLKGKSILGYFLTKYKGKVISPTIDKLIDYKQLSRGPSSIQSDLKILDLSLVGYDISLGSPSIILKPFFEHLTDFFERLKNLHESKFPPKLILNLKNSLKEGVEDLRVKNLNPFFDIQRKINFDETSSLTIDPLKTFLFPNSTDGDLNGRLIQFLEKSMNHQNFFEKQVVDLFSFEVNNLLNSIKRKELSFFKEKFIKEGKISYPQYFKLNSDNGP